MTTRRATRRGSCSTILRTGRSSSLISVTARRPGARHSAGMTIHTATALNAARLIAKYDGRTPRYTSYPTAVQFTPEVTAQTYRRWLSELPEDAPVSLYLH